MTSQRPPSTHASQARDGEASVRAATPHDAPAVGAVQAASWRQGYAGLIPQHALARFEPQQLAHAWSAALSQPLPGGHALLLACHGSQVVGLAGIGPSPDPDADELTSELLVLGVHPDARGAGHGSGLLRAAAERARDGGAATLVAWVPRDDSATRAFLQRAGMVPDSAWRDRAVDDAGAALREVRLVAALEDLHLPPAPADPSPPQARPGRPDAGAHPAAGR